MPEENCAYKTFSFISYNLGRRKIPNVAADDFQIVTQKSCDNNIVYSNEDPFSEIKAICDTYKQENEEATVKNEVILEKVSFHVGYEESNSIVIKDVDSILKLGEPDFKHEDDEVEVIADEEKEVYLPFLNLENGSDNACIEKDPLEIDFKTIKKGEALFGVNAYQNHSSAIKSLDVIKQEELIIEDEVLMGDEEKFDVSADQNHSPDIKKVDDVIKHEELIIEDEVPLEDEEVLPRTQRTVQLLKVDAEIFSFLGVSKYEAYEGTTRSEQDAVLMEIKKNGLPSVDWAAVKNDSISDRQDEEEEEENLPSGDTFNTTGNIGKDSNYEGSGNDSDSSDESNRTLFYFERPSFKKNSEKPVFRADFNFKKPVSVVNEEPQDQRQMSNKKSRHKNFCLYCKSFVGNFARHLRCLHYAETDVKHFLSKPLKSKERLDIISVIRKKGNYIQSTMNKAVRAVRNGSLNDSVDTHLPCEYCLGFYSRKHLWKHKRQCVQNPRDGKNSSLAVSQNLLCESVKTDERLKAEVFPRMRADNISLVAKKDQLICEFGSKYLKRHQKKHFISVTSRKMRELSKLLIQIQKNEPTVKCLLDCLKPEYYDLLVQGTKGVAKFNKENKRFDSPTYAININKSLRDCCLVAIHLVKKYTESTAAAKAEDNLNALLNLLKFKWQYDVSSLANRQLGQT